MPKTVSYYNYNNKLYSSVEVTAISYEFECYGDGKVALTAKFSGKKHTITEAQVKVIQLRLAGSFTILTEMFLEPAHYIHRVSR